MNRLWGRRCVSLGVVIVVAACARRSALPPAPVPSDPATAVGDGARDGAGRRSLGALADIEPAAVAEAVRSHATDHWYGTYRRRTKVGYLHMWMRPTAPDEPGAYVHAMEGMTKLGPTPEYGEIRSSMRRYYASAYPHRLLEVRVDVSSPDGPERASYRREGGVMKVERWEAGTLVDRREVAASDENVGYALFHLVLGRPGAGARALSYAAFDEDAALDRQWTVELSAPRRATLAGVELELYQLVARAKGHPATESIVTGTGETLRVAGAGVRLELEDKRTAQSEVIGFDWSAVVVPSPRPLGDPRQVRELSVVLGGLGELVVPARPNQRVERLADGRVGVTIVAGPGATVGGAEPTEALAVTAAVDVDDPAIVALARSITEGAADPRAAVARIVAWVHGNLRGALSTRLETASQVLAERRGDCTEFTLLFIALARAAGVPARELSGLTYAGDGGQVFAWHAWAEVALDGRWVPVDASWNEPLANASHIVLGVGDDTAYVPVMMSGTVEIEVRSVVTAQPAAQP